MLVEVLYKDYDKVTGKPILSKGTFKAWNHEGDYTMFYDNVSLDSVVFIIPTQNVCWIDIIRE
jgi:hypothetical protein